MTIELYTRDRCSTCTYTKKILKEQNIQFTEHKIGVDIEINELRTKFPHAQFLPVVIVDGVFIGTKDQLFMYLSEQGESKDVGRAA